MDKVKELISQAQKNYEKALELLSNGDYYDAAEKAWNSIEYLRKAFLVALKIPYEKAKTVSQGLVLFSDVLRKLGRKDLLRMYDQLMLKLHILGFYEQVTPPDEIEELLWYTVRDFMSKMRKLINEIKGLDLSKAIEFMDKIAKIKRDILAKNLELYSIRQSYMEYLEQSLLGKKSK